MHKSYTVLVHLNEEITAASPEQAIAMVRANHVNDGNIVHIEVIGERDLHKGEGEDGFVQGPSGPQGPPIA